MEEGGDNRRVGKSEAQGEVNVDTGVKGIGDTIEDMDRDYAFLNNSDVA